jgi:hypothetical protein
MTKIRSKVLRIIKIRTRYKIAKIGMKMNNLFQRRNKNRPINQSNKNHQNKNNKSIILYAKLVIFLSMLILNINNILKKFIQKPNNKFINFYILFVF